MAFTGAVSACVYWAGGFDVTRHGYLKAQPCTPAGIQEVYTKIQSHLIDLPDSNGIDTSCWHHLEQIRRAVAVDTTVDFSVGVWFIDPPSGVAVGSTTVHLYMGSDTSWLVPQIICAGEWDAKKASNLLESTNMLEIKINQMNPGEPVFAIIPYRGIPTGISKSDYSVSFSKDAGRMAPVDSLGSKRFKLSILSLVVLSVLVTGFIPKSLNLIEKRRSK